MMYTVIKSDLHKGNILPIYRNFTEFTDCEGVAVLIEKKEYGKSFILDDLPENKTDCITYKCEKWDIIFVEGPNKGFRTIRSIPYIWKRSQLVTSGEQGYKEYKWSNKNEQHVMVGIPI